MFRSPSSEILNEEQKAAVKNIVNANNRPLPFLLFGPPGQFFNNTKYIRVFIITILIKGTGKTRTLVVAVEEIIRSSNNCILICANSNAACDEITTRLLDVLSANDVHRLYAKSYKLEMISQKIKPICNIKNNKIEMPSLEYLYQFRVIVCTLLTAGFIVRARKTNKNFHADHFSHVIIDEAACCHQTVALTAIAGNSIIFCSIYHAQHCLTQGKIRQIDSNRSK